MEYLVTTAEENVELLIAAIFIFSMGLAIVEFFVEWHQKKLTKWRLKEMLSSFMVFLPAQLTEKAANTTFIAGFFLLAQIIPWEIPVNGWTLVLAILVIDFLYYWEHRWEHEIRVLWSYHSIHHSSPIYNYTTAFRVSFIDNFVTWVFYLPAIAMGFHPVVVLLAIVFILTYQFWIHTELIRNMGWFEKIFNSPSHHRVHHGSDDIYLDKNYGAVLIIWDRIFGTFQKEEHPPTYGLTTQINTIHPINVHLFEYKGILRDLRRAKNPKEVFGYLFNRPGWKPKPEIVQKGELR